MTRTLKRIAILLIITMLAPTALSFIPSIGYLTTQEVSAAETKATIGRKDVTVGVNSSPEYIYIENWQDSATYSYSVKDKKIATVDKYGLIKGVAKGKTTVTVTQNLNGVKKEVGKVNVTVKLPYVDKNLEVGMNGSNYIYINFPNKDATYTYKSANSKIAKIDEYGSISGVAYGKTKVTVTQTLKGKKTTVGTITVNVTTGKLADKSMEVPVKDPYSYDYIRINNYNAKATYKFTSANTKIAKVDKDGVITGVKIGSTTISVTETYNKKTTKLGSIKVTVAGSSINPDYSSIEIGINSNNQLTNLIGIKYFNYEAVYTAVSEDSSIVSAEYEVNKWGTEEFRLKGVSLGTTTLTIYEQSKGAKKRSVGTVKVTVKEIPITRFEFYSYYFDMIDDMPTLTYYMDDEYYYDNLLDMMSYDPYDFTTTVTYTCSDENVISIDNTGHVTLNGAGTAGVTATCGEFTLEFNVIVKESSYY